MNKPLFYLIIAGMVMAGCKQQKYEYRYHLSLVRKDLNVSSHYFNKFGDTIRYYIPNERDTTYIVIFQTLLPIK